MSQNTSKYITYGDKSNDFSNPLYDAEYAKSMDDKEGFWAEQAKSLVWVKEPVKVLDESHEHLHRWFPDAEMNICYNCVDRHVDEGRGHLTALSYDSAYTGQQQQFSYAEMQGHVGKLATALKEEFGVKSGDRVLIYMPMVP